MSQNSASKSGRVPCQVTDIPPGLKMTNLNYLENQENVKIMSQNSASKSGRVTCKVPSHSSMSNLKYWENQAGGSWGTKLGPLRVLGERIHSSMISNSRFFSECTQKPGFRFRADGSLKSMDESFWQRSERTCSPSPLHQPSEKGKNRPEAPNTWPLLPWALCHFFDHFSKLHFWLF